jgi:type IV secretion system protein VirB5
MPAVHKKTVYKPISLPNPFAGDADKAFSDILADKMKEASLWRITAFANIGFFLISLILFFISASRQAVVPVLVNVMPSGEPQYLGEVRQTGNAPVSEASVHWWIKSYVAKLRTVSTDYMVVYQNIDDCFIMITAGFTPILRKNLQDDSPFAQVGKIRRSVEIESVLHITGGSYSVNWTETSFDASANQSAKKMRAVVSVRVVTPTETTIKRNPLGIYIENFEMTEL